MPPEVWSRWFHFTGADSDGLLALGVVAEGIRSSPLL
jgi:hypothetical protein